MEYYLPRNWLGALTYEELSQIAKNENILIDKSLEKEHLLAIVSDALEEKRQEREENISLTIRVEAKKFFVSQDEEYFLDFERHIRLPERYRENSIGLILRDPSWLYCYWDLDERTLGELEAKPDFNGLLLRVVELKSRQWTPEGVLNQFDIPVRFGDLSRYINIPVKDRFYAVDLCAEIGENVTTLLRSKTAESSRDFAVQAPVGENPNRDKLFGMAGFSSDIGVFPGPAFPNKDNPQRIMGPNHPKEI